MTLLCTNLLDLAHTAKIPNKISDIPDNLKKFKTPVKKDDSHVAKSLVALIFSTQSPKRISGFLVTFADSPERQTVQNRADSYSLQLRGYDCKPTDVTSCSVKEP